MADAAKRGLGQVVVEQGPTRGDHRREVVVDEAGLDRVDADPLRAELVGGIAAQHVDPGFGGPIGPQPAMWEVSRPRRHDHDRPAPFHVGQHGLQGEDRAGEVQVDRRPHCGGIGRGDIPDVKCAARVGETAGDPPLPAQLGRHDPGSVDLLGLGHVGRNPTHLSITAAQRLKFAGRGRKPRLRPTTDHNPSTARHQTTSRRQSNATAPARD